MSETILPTQVVASAPGKVILHGEHSVVHGKKAIACAIGSRVTASASLLSQENVLLVSIPSLHSASINVDVGALKSAIRGDVSNEELISQAETFIIEALSDNVNHHLHLSLSCLLYAYCRVFLVLNQKMASPSLSLHVESELPIGAGLGSSAAFNTAIACCFLVISGGIRPCKSRHEFSILSSDEDLKKISSLAFEMEKIVHKTPSGIDNSISTFGGAVLFQNGCIEKLEKMPKLNLLIIDTKVPRSTKVLVSKVAAFLHQFPNVVNPILEAMHNITLSAQKLLEEIHDNPSNKQLTFDLGKLVATNQHLLSGLGVSHASLDKVYAIAQRYGFPAKLTGAGGGGCAIVLLNGFEHSDQSTEMLKNELEGCGYSCSEAVLGGPGVLVKFTAKD